MLEEEILRRASMERLDSATAGLIEQEVRGRLPEGMVDGVAVLQYGDDPAVEPGQIVVEVTIAAGPEGGEDPLETFHRAHRDAIQQLQRDICQRARLRRAARARSGDREPQIPVLSRDAPALEGVDGPLLAGGAVLNHASMAG
jgi:hypothetical protein